MIIKAKLIAPDLPRRWVPRPRLATQLAEFASSHHVVWVCATAGAGKTTAVVEALADSSSPVAWLTLDPPDGAPGRLLSYLEAALAGVYPDLAEVASRALHARTSHVEAAGLLADAIADRPVVLVVDQLERVADAPKALAVLAAFVRYAPRSLHTIVCSRRELMLETHSTAAWVDAIRVGEADLAFTVPEAREAMALRVGAPLDAAGAVAATGGWVTGVLFEAWRSEQHVYGAGGEADPLHGYLAAHILADLDDAQREFLIWTALCDEVNVKRSEALGLVDGGARLSDLRRLHLPASWNEERRSIRFHPRLREYLLELLGRRPDAEVTALRRRYVALLREERRLEEATELLIDLGDLAEAVSAAEEAIGPVLERLDLTVAERWIATLTPQPGGSSQRLATAELMVAVGREDYAHGTAASDRLRRMMGDDVLYDTDLAALMVMCYWLAERYDDAHAVVLGAQDGPAVRLLGWANDVEQLDGNARYADEPPAYGGALDAIPLRLHWTHGHLTRLLEPHPSPWVEAVHLPWRISALMALGAPRRGGGPERRGASRRPEPDVPRLLHAGGAAVGDRAGGGGVARAHQGPRARRRHWVGLLQGAPPGARGQAGAAAAPRLGPGAGGARPGRALPGGPRGSARHGRARRLEGPHALARPARRGGPRAAAGHGRAADRTRAAAAAAADRRLPGRGRVAPGQRAPR